jgi:hypothetical protein
MANQEPLQASDLHEQKLISGAVSVRCDGRHSRSADGLSLGRVLSYGSPGQREIEAGVPTECRSSAQPWAPKERSTRCIMMYVMLR